MVCVLDVLDVPGSGKISHSYLPPSTSHIPIPSEQPAWAQYDAKLKPLVIGSRCPYPKSSAPEICRRLSTQTDWFPMFVCHKRHIENATANKLPQIASNFPSTDTTAAGILSPTVRSLPKLISLTFLFYPY